MTDHIADRLKKYFATEGWIHADMGAYTKATKNITFEKLAGTISDGTRLVELRLNDSGRWLEAVDGWGATAACVDLRGFWEKTAHEAVTAVIEKAYPL